MHNLFYIIHVLIYVIKLENNNQHTSLLFSSNTEMNNKTSINATDLIRTSRRIYNSLHNQTNSMSLAINQSLDVKAAKNIHHQFLDKINKTKKLRRGICFDSKHNGSKDISSQKKLMVESHRSNTPWVESNIQNNIQINNLQKIEHKNATSYINHFRRNKMVKTYIQSQIREFQINLRQKRSNITDNISIEKQLKTLDEQKLSPFQISINKKKINRMKMKINSLQHNYRYQGSQNQEEETKKSNNYSTIVNNRISRIKKTSIGKNKNIYKDSPLTKSINLVPISESRQLKKSKQKFQSNKSSNFQIE